MANTNVAPSTGGNLSHSPTNDPEVLAKQKFEKLLEVTGALGKRAGQGADVQVQHLLAVVQGAYEGYVDLTENKHGTGVDDAQKIAEAYWAARNKEVVFDAKAPNQRKTISCVRTCLRLGGWNKGGPGEPLAMINRAMSTYKALRKDLTVAKRLVDAANYLIAIGRQVNKRDELMDDAELRTLAFKPDAEIVTVEERLAAIRKEMTNFRDGKHKAGVLGGPNVEAVIRALNKELTSIAMAKRSLATADAAADASADIIAAAKAQEKNSEPMGEAAPTPTAA